MIPNPVRLLNGAARDIGDVAGDVARDLGDVARDLGTRAGLIAEPPPPPPPAPSGAWAVAARAQAVATPAARAIVGPVGPAARALAGPVGPAARAVAGPAGAVASPAARALAARVPQVSRTDAARAASARMARGGGGVVMPEPLAHRLGLPAGQHAVATPGIGQVVGVRDLAVGFLVISTLDDPVRLRAALTLAAVVDATDAAIFAAPMFARRVGGRATLKGGALAMRAADLWHRTTRWE
jgi:hypothetical protein